jgi:hypothetical protein
MALTIRQVKRLVQIQRDLFLDDAMDVSLSKQKRFAASICTKQLGIVLGLLNKIK